MLQYMGEEGVPYPVTVQLLKTVDLKKKQKDFEHLLFNKANSEKILRFGEFIDSLTE